MNQSNIWIVGLGTERSNPDYYALSVMNQIFSGGFGSRLFQNVRTQDGTGVLRGRSVWRIVRSSRPLLHRGGNQEREHGRCDQGDAGADRRPEDEPFTDEELRRAKDELLNSFIFRYDTPEKVLTERAKLEFYGYPADFLEKYRAAIEKVTTADLEHVAKKYIDRSKLAILVVGNVQQIDTGTPGQPGKPLSELGPVHPVDITIPMPPGMQGGADRADQ